MYFASFDSFTQAVESATVFSVVINLRDGTIASSSQIPIEALGSVQQDIASCEETGGWLTVWDRHKNGLTSVPAYQIKSVQINFG